VRKLPFVFAGAALLAACGHPAPEPPKTRNLLLIVVDTLRRDHLPLYGYGRNTAPRLAELGSEGAVLDGLSTSSWTKPSVASILTGLHPVRHQAVLEDALPDSAVTLAERLSSRGFRTVAITSNAHISPTFGFAQGFDDFESLMKDFDSGELPRPRDLSRAVLERLDALEPPYFLYLHYLDPHAPYDPESAWDGGRLPEHLRTRAPMLGIDMQHRHFKERDPQFLRDAIDLYDGEIRGVDDDISRVLTALGSRGLMDGTLTVVTADHGEEFEEHGRMGHGKALYGEGVQVPLVFHAPGVVAPGVIAGRASVLDIVPTALELLGFEGEGDGFDGISHAAELRAGEIPADESREFLLFLDLREVGRMGSLALERGSDKLVLTRFPHSKELFDLDADPGEAKNRFDDPTRGAARRELSRRLAERYQGLVSRKLPRAEAIVDDSTSRALEALGYADHAGAPPDYELPTSIRPADADPLGLLGWEPTTPDAACLDTASSDAVARLLFGWEGEEFGGRWTEPLATVALARPEEPVGGLELEGINPLHEEQRVRVTVAKRVRDLLLPSGRFRQRVRVQVGDGEGPLKIRIERLPPLVPGKVSRGGRVGLGVFLTRLCLVGP
jgi:arylsulfatase A-like enzyme